MPCFETGFGREQFALFRSAKQDQSLFGGFARQCLFEMKIAQGQVGIVQRQPSASEGAMPQRLLFTSSRPDTSPSVYMAVEAECGLQKRLGDAHRGFSRFVGLHRATFPKRSQFLVHIDCEPFEIVGPDARAWNCRKRNRARELSRRD